MIEGVGAALTPNIYPHNEVLMIRYANLNGDSGIAAYELTDDGIIVEFIHPTRAGHRYYKYSYASAGYAATELMKGMAQRGHGLNSFISTRRPRYSSKSSSSVNLV